MNDTLSFPTPFFGSTTIACGYQLVSFGGMDELGKFSNQLVSLDVVENSILLDFCADSGQLESSVAQNAHQIQSLGSMSSKSSKPGFLDDVFIDDETSLTKRVRSAQRQTAQARQVDSTGSLPQPRAGHVATWDGSKMYVFGGKVDKDTTSHALFEISLDPFDVTLTKLEQPLTNEFGIPKSLAFRESWNSLIVIQDQNMLELFPGSPKSQWEIIDDTVPDCFNQQALMTDGGANLVLLSSNTIHSFNFVMRSWHHVALDNTVEIAGNWLSTCLRGNQIVALTAQGICCIDLFTGSMATLKELSNVTPEHQMIYFPSFDRLVMICDNNEVSSIACDDLDLNPLPSVGAIENPVLSCAADQESALYGFGYAGSGSLGKTKESFRRTVAAIEMPHDENFRKIICGNASAVAGIDLDDRMWIWGGPFGDQMTLIPPSIIDNEEAIDVWIGIRFVIILTRTGRLFKTDITVRTPEGIDVSSVINDFREIILTKDGEEEEESSSLSSLWPFGKPNATTRVFAIKIAGGSMHCCCLTSTGTVYVVGDNRYGQCGMIALSSQEPDIDLVTKMTPINSLPNVTFIDVFCGDECTAMVTSNHAVYCCGNLSALPIPVNKSKKQGKFLRTPRKVPDLSGLGIKKLTFAKSCGFALDVNGDVYHWGKTKGGRLGRWEDDEEDSRIEKPVKSEIDGVVDLISCGIGRDNHFAIALTQSNTLMVWGSSTCGALGLGGLGESQTPRPIPVDIEGRTVKISGLELSCFILVSNPDDDSDDERLEIGINQNVIEQSNLEIDEELLGLFHNVPDEVVFLILQHLEAKDLVRLSRTNSIIHDLALSDELWRDIYASTLAKSSQEVDKVGKSNIGNKLSFAELFSIEMNHQHQEAQNRLETIERIESIRSSQLSKLEQKVSTSIFNFDLRKAIFGEVEQRTSYIFSPLENAKKRELLYLGLLGTEKPVLDGYGTIETELVKADNKVEFTVMNFIGRFANPRQLMGAHWDVGLIVVNPLYLGENLQPTTHDIYVTFRSLSTSTPIIFVMTEHNLVDGHWRHVADFKKDLLKEAENENDPELEVLRDPSRVAFVDVDYLNGDGVSELIERMLYLSAMQKARNQ